MRSYAAKNIRLLIYRTRLPSILTASIKAALSPAICSHANYRSFIAASHLKTAAPIYTIDPGGEAGAYGKNQLPLHDFKISRVDSFHAFFALAQYNIHEARKMVNMHESGPKLDISILINKSSLRSTKQTKQILQLICFGGHRNTLLFQYFLSQPDEIVMFMQRLILSSPKLALKAITPLCCQLLESSIQHTMCGKALIEKQIDSITAMKCATAIIAMGKSRGFVGSDNSFQITPETTDQCEAAYRDLLYSNLATDEGQPGYVLASMRTSGYTPSADETRITLETLLSTTGTNAAAIIAVFGILNQSGDVYMTADLWEKFFRRVLHDETSEPLSRLRDAWMLYETKGKNTQISPNTSMLVVGKLMARQTPLAVRIYMHLALQIEQLPLVHEVQSGRLIIQVARKCLTQLPALLGAVSKYNVRKSHILFASLKAVTIAKDKSLVKYVEEALSQEQSPEVMTSVLAMHFSLGEVELALKVFEKLASKPKQVDRPVINVLVHGVSRCIGLDEGLKIAEQFERKMGVKGWGAILAIAIKEKREEVVQYAATKLVTAMETVHAYSQRKVPHASRTSNPPESSFLTLMVLQWTMHYHGLSAALEMLRSHLIPHTKGKGFFPDRATLHSLYRSAQIEGQWEAARVLGEALKSLGYFVPRFDQVSQRARESDDELLSEGRGNILSQPMEAEGS